MGLKPNGNFSVISYLGIKKGIEALNDKMEEE